ncbi:unnamed protein product [Spirodela intermedia]|uniref:RING-type E3 ubiquitin transferase n=1 Tax=Spirodela intermedia TaxID=51605 RepID=A0A7I8KAC9_SPIIN|nr:unnamed protein product [Spirodela intermedia]
MDKTVIMEKLSSAAAFVEGGIQDACDDACSICLENFCESDPSTVTGCKHEFHLQCILEWCQRSSQCPMCWQLITLKDPTSQELLEAVERERSLRFSQPRGTTALFHHPVVGDFELQHLPVGVNDAELEERIIQHLAAAAAMGRTRHLGRRDGGRRRPAGGQGHHPQFLVFPAHPHYPLPPSSEERETDGDHPSVGASSAASPSPPAPPPPPPPLPSGGTQESSSSSSRPSAMNWNSGGPGPSSELQSFSESLKSRLNAVSVRGWKERFFSRGSSVSDLGSEVRREINQGITTVSRMIERLDLRDTHPPPDDGAAAAAASSSSSSGPTAAAAAAPEKSGGPGSSSSVAAASGL